MSKIYFKKTGNVSVGAGELKTKPIKYAAYIIGHSVADITSRNLQTNISQHTQNERKLSLFINREANIASVTRYRDTGVTDF